MSSTDRKIELKAKTSVVQTGSHPFVYAKCLIDIFILLSERHNTLNTTHSDYSYTYVDVILSDKGRNKLPKHAVVNTGVHSVVIDPIIRADIDSPTTLSFHHPFTQLSPTI
jgi:hypothetical protein